MKYYLDCKVQIHQRGRNHGLLLRNIFGTKQTKTTGPCPEIDTETIFKAYIFVHLARLFENANT